MQQQRELTRNQSGNDKRLRKLGLVFTGQSTFSSAENFAYDMQSLKRAIIVGVNTKGGANPGREFTLGNSFYAFIPTGRSYSYITKSNWEGAGIKPDILTEEDKSLDIAIEEAAK